MSNLNQDSIEKLYSIFRRKLQEVYRRNHKPDPFGRTMTSEFNAWQGFLRNSLKLEVEETDRSRLGEINVDKKGEVTVKIPNPSNGMLYGYENIVVPSDLAEKILALGDIPDEL
jgi:hypothetical protein